MMNQHQKKFNKTNEKKPNSYHIIDDISRIPQLVQEGVKKYLPISNWSSEPAKPNYAFIDAQNLHQSSKHWGWKLDYEKLRKYLRNEYQVEVAYLFLGFIPDNQEIYNNLQKHGYILVFKETVEKMDEIKGNCDVELALQAMIDFPNYNQAVIVSGDGDFSSLIRYLNQQNKLRCLLVPNKSAYSKFLQKSAKEKIAFLNNLKSKLFAPMNNHGMAQQPENEELDIPELPTTNNKPINHNSQSNHPKLKYNNLKQSTNNNSSQNQPKPSTVNIHLE